MKIWSVVENDDAGVNVTLFAHEASAERFCAEWADEVWANSVLAVDHNDQKPATWRAVMDRLYSLTGRMDSIQLDAHEVELSVDPAFQASPEAQAYREAAPVDDELELDESAMVSKGDDAGAWVQCWVWVDDEAAGICRICGEANADNGEGWDGMCGNCADKAYNATEAENEHAE